MKETLIGLLIVSLVGLAAAVFFIRSHDVECMHTTEEMAKANQAEIAEVKSEVKQNTGRIEKLEAFKPGVARGHIQALREQLAGY